MPASAERSIDAVARYIAARELDPIERIKALHDWVADRISYDTAAWRGDVPLEDAYPEDVFRNRRAVCAGYARLLEELGNAVGIPIRTVHGMTSMGLHAWNIVALGGRVYQIDVTWDAGRVVKGRFIKSYSTDYLFFTGRADHHAYRIRERHSDDYEPPYWKDAARRLRQHEAPLSHSDAWQAFKADAAARRAALQDQFWSSVDLSSGARGAAGTTEMIR